MTRADSLRSIAIPVSRHAALTLAVSALSLLSLTTPGAVRAATLTRTSAFTYDTGTGLLTKEIIEPANANLCLVTTYAYDAYGNKTLAATRNCGVGGDPTGVGTAGEASAPSGAPLFALRTNSNTFDARGQFPTTSSNALNQSETKTYNADYGTVASLTGPNNLTTAWAYDNFGRKIGEQRADGNGSTWNYQYCNGINGGTASCPTIGGAAGVYVVTGTPVGGIVINTAGLITNAGSPNGALNKTYYDTLNRPIRIETQGYDGSGASTAIYQDTQYDNLGRPYKTSRPYYSGQTAYWTTLTYDALGRVIVETQADSSTTQTSYNGLTTVVTNANSQTKTTVKNSQGQIISVTDTQTQTLSYAYDPFGNLLQTTDALGNLTTLSYDLRGRKTQMIDADMGNWSYVYDALGQLVQQTDAKAQLTTLAYDLLGRITVRSEADLISHWYYDTYKGGGACAKGIGKLCQSETDHGYGKTLVYDSLGRYSSASTTIDAGYGDSAAYDSNGRLLSRTYPSGLVVQYTYTALGYLKQISDSTTGAAPWTTLWTANSLDAEGHLLQQTAGNGIVTNQAYNAANGRLTGITAGAGNAVQNLAYTYDNLGNIYTRNDANQTLIESFTYDTLNRLQTATVSATAVSPAVTTTYAYNAIGNMISRSDLTANGSGYTYPGAGVSSVRPHAVSRVDFSTGPWPGQHRTYSYDANGNLAGEAQYDASNNPVLGPGRVATFTSFNMPNVIYNDAASQVKLELSNYGPEHQRLTSAITTAAGTRTTIYLNPDNAGSLFFEKETKVNGDIEQRNFITAGGQVIAIVKVINGVVSNRYLHRDNLGSTTAVTDDSAAIVERLAYEPFGNRRFPNGVSDDTASSNNTIVAQNTNRGFTNHEQFDELDIVHMNGRIYDPIIGRFVSADPYVQAPYNLQSYNRYTYAQNNPLMFIDPTGYSLWTKIRDIAIRAAAAWADENGCGGYCSAAVGSYQGYRDGGLTGAVTGGVSGYFGAQYPLTDKSGNINWDNVIKVGSVNAGAGCINASAAGGSCGRGALAGATGTVGAAYGFMGAVIAGCAGGRISGGTCSDGAWDAVGTYAVSRAASGAFNYIVAAASAPPLARSNDNGSDNNGNIDSVKNVSETLLPSDDAAQTPSPDKQPGKLILAAADAPVNETVQFGTAAVTNAKKVDAAGDPLDAIMAQDPMNGKHSHKEVNGSVGELNAQRIQPVVDQTQKGAPVVKKWWEWRLPLP